MYILLLIIGFIALLKGADWFVDGSSALASICHIPGVIIGLTIVAFGTSAPELAVSTVAALSGSNEIALSNVVGSNIFNLLCVLGVCAVIRPLPVDDEINRRDFPVSILATVFALFATCSPAFFSGRIRTAAMEDVVGMVNRLTGLALLFIFVCYMVFLIIHAKKHPTEDPAPEKTTVVKSLLLILVGIACIVGGGQVVVLSAKEIARAFGMSETLIGLTIVAIGTSLPELVTSIVASRKGETAMAVGNAIGSNIFNLLFILGISATIHPVSVNMASLCDMAILIGISSVTFIFGLSGKRINRTEGIAMLLIYALDMVFAIRR
ncbi:MAG: calcium/sodium antiporter [Butyrivibrio sp.]|nr:calcium/sodium antiporter [Butyrivibrio sp.]